MILKIDKKEKGGRFSWFAQAGLAVPLLWGLVFIVDSVVIFVNMNSGWSRFLYMLAAFCLFAFFVLSPGNRILPLGEKKPKLITVLRAVFALLFTAGIAAFVIRGGDYISCLAMVQLGFSYTWILLPYFVLRGSARALNMLNISMLVGMLCWLVMFVFMAVMDGMESVLHSILSIKVIIFLVLTFIWYTAFAFGKGRDGIPFTVSNARIAAGNGWQKYFFLCLATSLCLVCAWIFTGFTNDGSGRYGSASYMVPFPFYDVAAYMQPFYFSNGPFLLLHSIPFMELLIPETGTGYKNVITHMTSIFWLGLACLAVAVYGIFCSILALRHIWPVRVFSVAAILASFFSSWQIMNIWDEFATRPYDPQTCKHISGALHTWGCGNISPGGIDNFMLVGHHIPAQACCIFALAFAIILLLMKYKKNVVTD